VNYTSVLVPTELYVTTCTDGTGGKIFLRVLLHLVMHDNPPLVSGALK
jgi:hypothetical protein